MKTKHLLLTCITIVLTAFAALAQDAADKSYKNNIPFGKKLPPPDLMNGRDKSLRQASPGKLNTALVQGIKHHNKDEIKKALDDYRQQLIGKRNERALPSAINNFSPVSNSSNLDFDITKDINALSESDPSNYSFYSNTSFAILDHVMYFAADDGIHGNELWRSDGTAAGTFMVRDVEPGSASSSPSSITAAHGKLYFRAFSAVYGDEPWISDGTQSGTQLLMDIKPGAVSSGPTEFHTLGSYVYFITDGDFSFLGAIWKTDGIATTLVTNIGDIDAGGEFISQVTKSNGLLFFTFISYSSYAWEIWRTDGTAVGTYHVGTNLFTYDMPLQLTDYNNKLYFSTTNINDSYDRKLWVSDGTDAGTTPAPGSNDVVINTYYNFAPFPVLKHVLYVPGSSLINSSNGLYKYDASNNEGLVEVKELTPGYNPYTVDPLEMKVANNKLYFRVINSASENQNELWSSKGTEASTKIVQRFLTGESISNLYDGDGTLYFVKYDKSFGAELWELVTSSLGSAPVIESNIFSGATSSYPAFLTAFQGKLFFAARNGVNGNELFMTNNSGFGATLSKDINTTTTSSSDAADYYGQITSLGDKVVFTAFDRIHGFEPYVSDGTAQTTFLLKDIIPGEINSYPYNFISKNDYAYFSALNKDGTYSIYRTDGTPNGTQKYITSNFNIQDYKVTDENLIFYVVYSYNTFSYELWRSNGTAAGTFIVSSTLYYSHYLNVVGSTAFFVAGDNQHGYELWKSNGSIAGTKMVKDINPGDVGSNPGGMFVFKNEVYFGAYDGVDHAFWKSDGTWSGTVQLKNIDPWWGGDVASTERYFFEVSNNTLYFSAINYFNSKGTQFWKTDGTSAGTEVVEDVNPGATGAYPYPSYFTDVNGTLFFIADDGVHGNELWKSDGTKEGTRLVKDITTEAGTFLSNLVSFNGKLFFTANDVLWSSDGTKTGTTPVNGELLSNFKFISSITTVNNHIFLAAYTYQYGRELYMGEVDEAGKFVTSKIGSEDAVKTNLSFNVSVYPNPVASKATLQIAGNTNNISISITDMNGKKLWQMNNSNATLVALPTENYVAGTYLLTITNGKESKTLKLVKQ